MDMNTWTMLAVVTSLMALWALAACASMERRVTRLRGELEEMVRPMERNLRALCTTQSRAGDRLLALEDQSRRLLERHNQLQMRAPSSEHFRHAIAMVACGASTEDLISNCGLAPGEAELVHLMHGAKRAERNGRVPAGTRSARRAGERK